MILDFDKNLIKKDDVIAVALSGGEDSMCLLYSLVELSKELNFTLKVINVEHGIRENSSKRDSDFCKQQAESLNLPFLSFSVDSPKFAKENGYTIEQAARILRYNCFFDAIKNNFAMTVATAHHKNDNFETILFNLFRGSGIAGAKGMERISFDNTIIRPFLSVSKEEIHKYVDCYHVPFVEDETNADDNLSRNYLRHEIIPRINERFPYAATSLSRFAQLCKEDDDFLNELAKNSLNINNDCVNISITLAKPIFARAAILAMKQLGIEKDYCYKHIESLLQLKTSETGKQINLLNNVIAVREYDEIKFKHNSAPLENVSYSFNLGIFNFPNYVVSIEKISLDEYKNIEKLRYSPINGNFIEVYADFKKLLFATLRYPQEGDVVNKISCGIKSLKKHFVDRKVPKLVRANLPIIAKDNQALLICGIEPSQNVAISQDTKEVVKITLVSK